jgi:hypothetical protein
MSFFLLKLKGVVKVISIKVNDFNNIIYIALYMLKSLFKNESKVRKCN